MGASLNPRDQAALEARERVERCRAWLKTLMAPGCAKPGTKDELFAYARDHLGANRSNFNAGWDLAIFDMGREDWYLPSPRRRQRDQ